MRCGSKGVGVERRGLVCVKLSKGEIAEFNLSDNKKASPNAHSEEADAGTDLGFVFECFKVGCCLEKETSLR